jgi:GNAT superfamily N-acetyltransferase
VSDGAAGLRPISEDDISACRAIFDAAQQALSQQLGQPWTPADATIMDRILVHLATSDPQRAWLAPGHGRAPAQGFGMAFERDGFWFLSFLFVRPEAQGAGLGRRLLEACLPAPHERRLLATCVDAVQPVSTALYAGYGIVPRVPLFGLLGDSPAENLPRLPRGVMALEFDRLGQGTAGSRSAGVAGQRRLADALATVDRQVVGFVRPQDHGFWRLDRRVGVLYTDRGSGRPLGYGYRTRGGRLGPVAVEDATLLPAVLADLARREQPPGRWQVLVPGPAERALVPLLKAGMRLEASPGLYCANGPSISLERYLPGSFSLP